MYYSDNSLSNLINESNPMLTKSESLQLKGAAILIMVFLHLFMTPSNVDLCRTYLYFRGEPVVSQLSKFTGI